MPSVEVVSPDGARSWPATTLALLNILAARGWTPKTGTLEAARATLTTTPTTTNSGATDPPIVLAGSNPAAARPATNGPVIWLCTTQPTHSDPAQDYWVPITGA